MEEFQKLIPDVVPGITFRRDLYVPDIAKDVHPWSGGDYRGDFASIGGI